MSGPKQEYVPRKRLFLGYARVSSSSQYCAGRRLTLHIRTLFRDDLQLSHFVGQGQGSG